MSEEEADCLRAWVDLEVLLAVLAELWLLTGAAAVLYLAR